MNVILILILMSATAFYISAEGPSQRLFGRMLDSVYHKNDPRNSGGTLRQKETKKRKRRKREKRKRERK